MYFEKALKVVLADSQVENHWTKTSGLGGTKRVKTVPSLVLSSFNKM